MARAPLVLALPTGRLLDPLAACLTRAGLPLPPVREAGRKLRLVGDDFEALFVKDWDLPIYVEHGAADLGIVGRDVLEEQPLPLYEPLDLGLGRCRMALARPEGRPIPPPPFRVATRYPRVAERYFGGRGVPVEVIRLSGAIELAPLVGLADAIVDLVESGATLRANGLVEEATLFESSARLVVNRAAFRLRGERIGAALRSLASAAGTS